MKDPDPRWNVVCLAVAIVLLWDLGSTGSGRQCSISGEHIQEGHYIGPDFVQDPRTGYG